MKPKNTPAKSQLSIFRQICQLIPGNLVAQLARESGIEKQCRKFSPWSHVCAMMYGQLAHAQSLNDLCDALTLEAPALHAIREAVPPSRNGLSHANRERSAVFAEKLYWEVQAHLKSSQPGFGSGHGKRNFAHRFKSRIHLVDATTIQLVANCMGWAQHRRAKAGVKCHCRLNLQSYLPSFALIDTAAEHESTRAAEVCAGLKAGEIAIMDKGYTDFAHMYDLNQRGVFWVIRAKDTLKYDVVREHGQPDGKILKDEVIRFHHHNAKHAYPTELRRIQALVEVDGKEVVMTFLTNNFQWQPQSVADLYRCRWQIELFFKSLKQDLQVADFVGYSANAIRWQIWMALLVHMLMRLLAWKSRWASHFGRVFTLLRAAAWRRLDLMSLLEFYGTADAIKRMRSRPEQAYLPGF
jgi:hypothetical protein